MYEKYCKLRDERGLRDADVARETHITPSTFSDWKKGTSKPKFEKLQKLAEYFGVPVAYFLADNEEEEQKILNMALDIAQENAENKKAYYADPATAAMMQQLFDSPGRRALFKAVENMDEESVQKYAEFIERITNDNNSNN